MAGRIRARIGPHLFPAAGCAGAAGLLGLGITSALPSATVPAIAIPALFLSGLSFLCLQSSLITTAQDLLPSHRGAVMSAASFTMVVSGALGTLVNGAVLAAGGFMVLLAFSSLAFAAAGLLAAAFLRTGGALTRTVREYRS